MTVDDEPSPILLRLKIKALRKRVQFLRNIGLLADAQALARRASELTSQAAAIERAENPGFNHDYQQEYEDFHGCRGCRRDCGRGCEK